MGKRRRRKASAVSRGASPPSRPSETLAEARPGMTPRRECAATVVLSAVVASFFHFGSPNIADLDSFYYIRLAWLYRTRGFFDVDFPWIEHSVIRDLSTSLWYGFGLFMVPFTWFSDLVTGIKVAGALLAVFALSSFYWAVKRAGIRMAVLWPFLFLFSAPNVLYQLIMTRPQLISLALGPLLFAFLIYGPRPAKGAPADGIRDVLPLFAIGLAFAWLHLNFIWLPLLILGVVSLTGWIVDKRVDRRRMAAVVAGALLGWLARPNPVGAARLLYVQSAQKLLGGEGDVALLSGGENLPLSTAVLLRNFIPFALLWVAALLATIAARSRAKTLPSGHRTLLGSSLALSLVFFLLTVFVGRRSYNLWTAFGVIFIAGAFTHILPLVSSGSRGFLRVAIQCALAGVLLFVAVDSSKRTVDTLSRSGYAPDMHRDTGLWLAEHSLAGDVVFNVRWSHFSPLFFWNQTDHYVAGLDPIFLYAHDRTLYWKFHHIAADPAVGRTCGSAVCGEDTAEDVHAVLVRDFKAKYVVVLKSDRPAYRFFETDARFRRELETNREAVYRVEKGPAT